MIKTTTALASVLGLALTLSAGEAFAGSKIFSSGSTVARVNGSVEGNVNQNRDPWVAQVFSTGNECLRIAVISQGTDLEGTLISPSGRIWQDDDSGGLNRPLIKAITDVRGWYPLTFSHWSGQLVNADFAMDIQRLPTTSPLCSPPTVPRSATAAASAKAGNNGADVPGGAN